MTDRERHSKGRGPVAMTIVRLRIIDSLLAEGKWYGASDLHRIALRRIGSIENSAEFSLRQVQQDMVTLEELCLREFPLGSLLPVTGPLIDHDTLRQIDMLKAESMSAKETCDAIDIGIKVPEGDSFATLFNAMAVMIFRTEESQRCNWLDRPVSSGDEGTRTGLRTILSRMKYPMSTNPGEEQNGGYIIPPGFDEAELWRIFKAVSDRIEKGDENNIVACFEVA